MNDKSLEKSGKLGNFDIAEQASRIVENSLAKKQQHDLNLILKVISEVGDICKFVRELEARVIKLERKLK